MITRIYLSITQEKRCQIMLQKVWFQFQRKRKQAGYTGVILWVAFSYLLMISEIPDQMYVELGEEPQMAFGVPVTGTVVDSTQAFANQKYGGKGAIHLTANTAGQQSAPSYQIVCKLFGAIPVKQISVQEVDKKTLLPAGTNIGIYVRCEKVMIIGTGEVIDQSGFRQEPAKNVVRSGDCILAVDGEEIQTKEQLVKKVASCSGNKIELLLKRNGETISVSVKPVRSKDGVYQIGLWVRDDIAGVGTLTYISDEMDYGALGHGVTDADLGSLLSLKTGAIYQTTILDVRKGKRGQPGEMSGMINYDEKYKLGSVKENTTVGIYGKLAVLPQEVQDVDALPVMYKEGIKKGKAQIISSVEGHRQAYDIEIAHTDYHSEGNNKGIQFCVTDRALLEDTGGIVQGMSGSPIVQDGHIIGAVTHVFISDSTQGYGIFIENMLEH